MRHGEGHGKLGKRATDARRELDEFTQQTDFLDRAEVMRLVDAKAGAEVWYLLNLALWHKEYIA